MSWFAERYFRIMGTKKIFLPGKEYETFMKAKAEAPDEEYRIPKSQRFHVSVQEGSAGGMQVFYVNRSARAPFTIIYVHGGAYVNNIYPQHWTLIDEVARETGAEFIVPIYPLAPKHTYSETAPVIRKIYENVISCSSDKQIVLMGDSAGGGFCAGFCEMLAAEGVRQPDKLILLSPWLDVRMENPDIQSFEDLDPMLGSWGLREMGTIWAGDVSPEDYRISPITGDVSGLRNVTMFVGTREIFNPDVKAFYHKLRQNGVSAKLWIGNGMNHVWPLYPISEAVAAREKICEAIYL